MTPDELQERAKQLSLRVMKLVDVLTTTTSAREMAKQLVRSGMSVSANYRAARRVRSRKEFIAKIGVVVEEADETAHWLELATESGLVPPRRLQALRRETEELVAIFSRIRCTARIRAARKNADGKMAIAKSPHRQIAK